MIMYGNHLTREALNLLQKEQQKKLNKAFASKIAKASLAATLMQIWFAQLIVWGLSLFHVSSGLWGPFLILEGVSSAIVWAVHIGMMNAVKGFQEVQLEQQ